MKQLSKKILLFVIFITCLFINANYTCAETTLNCSTTLKKGTTGTAVKQLQTELNKVMNCGLTVDGTFGTKTRTCVITFQKKNSLTKDGIVGPKTCKKLNEIYTKEASNTTAEDTEKEITDLICSTSNTLKRGKNNNKVQVEYLQKKLNETMECRLPVTGIYGKNTEKCVKKFQKEINLKDTGIVGPNTCKKLNEIYPKIVTNKNNPAFEKQGNEKTLNCHNTLEQGDTGDNVKILQTELNKVTSCKLKVDGDYGTKTKTCVKKFQKSQKLTADGVVGASTCNNLNTNFFKSNTYVISRFTSIRKSASNSSEEVAFTPYGIVFKVYETVGKWYKIKYNNQYHYIKKSEVDTTGIIVDLSEQSLKFYEDGKLKMDFIVITGNKSTHNTRTGKFTIEYKEKGRMLRGTSYVDYWMKFDKGNGFHDADGWRSDTEFYDANRYNGNGSHGCVNMLDANAKALYEAADLGTLVIVKK